SMLAQVVCDFTDHPPRIRRRTSNSPAWRLELPDSMYSKPDGQDGQLTAPPAGYVFG
ncbi:MAG: hypothetical protein IPP47_21505, partial [Bryobacterales bacterium]|nr:hypothetical protein [Bryobacterales bacterium]